LQNSARAQGLLPSLRQILSHGIITMLAVAIAFSLPQVAGYILYRWWPLVERDPNLLLATEIGTTSILVLLFNFAKIIWDNWKKVKMAKLTALAYARDCKGGRLLRRRERALVKEMSAARDVYVLSLTGYHTFVEDDSLLREALRSAYEIRVLLINPGGTGLRRRVDSMPSDITLLSYHKEIETSIAHLAELRKGGKNISLKFYDQEPFWKVVVLGDHVWVQHFHTGSEVKYQPEYVFALQHHNPREGLYVPFYVHFLDQWNQPDHPVYDFQTNELVYRDAAGNERSRAPLGVPIDGGRHLVHHGSASPGEKQAASVRASTSSR
jgi:hypothetical protein